MTASRHQVYATAHAEVPQFSYETSCSARTIEDGHARRISSTALTSFLVGGVVTILSAVYSTRGTEDTLLAATCNSRDRDQLVRLYCPHWAEQMNLIAIEYFTLATTYYALLLPPLLLYSTHQYSSVSI